MSDCLTAALRYASRGWKVFPLKGKKPYKGTHGFRDATTNRKQIRRWWRKWPEANVGIACDSQHGPIVIDLDGPSGLRYMQELGMQETKEATSGTRGKRHLYYDPPLDNSEVARMIRPLGKQIDLDVLGDGGYVVAPPSVHPETGRKYRWENNRIPRRYPAVLLEKITVDIKRRTNGSAPPLPKQIGEGQRDTLLTSLAGSMRRRGASEDAILAALREENDTRVNPPLPLRDLKRIAGSIARKVPAIPREHLTDMGNARRFISRYESAVRAVMVNRRPWLIWDESRWISDTTGEIDRYAKQTVLRIYSEASQEADEETRDSIIKHASKSESAPRVRAMLDLAATESEISTTPDQLDANPWLFNVLNGTIDLRTGKLSPHRREDLITKLSSVEYDPRASAPRWEKFLLEVMKGDTELVGFLQRAVGYALTGDTREECLFFLYGQGSNGKTTLLEILRSLFGEYARQSDFSTFLSNRGDGPRNDLARMHGARLVTASEADAERGFDARIIKLLTGGDTIVARKLYEEHTEFISQHKLFLAANHKPIVKEQTEGFWRRMRLIPFAAVFTANKRDKRLRSKLMNELPGILNWAIEGCRLWRKDGLQEPAAVTKATRSYRDENDILGEYLASYCTLDPSVWTPTSKLYQAFREWWMETRGNNQPLSMGWFIRLMAERPEFKQIKHDHERGWKGIRLAKKGR